MTVELNEESTKEDIDAAVDQIIADRAGEGGNGEGDSPNGENSPNGDNDSPTDGEQLGNGKAVTEREENTADTDDKSGSEDGDEKTADWRKEAVADVAAYGLGEEDIAEFQSREELDRALKLYDRQMDSERKKVRDSEGEDKGGKDQESSEKPKKGDADGKFEIRLDKDVYDDELVEEFTRMRDHYESQIASMDERFAALEERFAEADAQVAEERFDRAVDDLGFAKLFGKTGEESKTELERRQQLFEHVQVEQEVMARLGREVDYGSLVTRVARALFPDDWEKKLIQNHTRKISRQTDKRQGGGATRPTDPPQTVREEMRQYYKELEQSG